MFNRIVDVQECDATALTTNKGQSQKNKDNVLIDNKLQNDFVEILVPKSILHLYFNGTDTSVIISSESLRLLLDKYSKDNAVISANPSASHPHKLS